ncbi:MULTISPECIES: hypothetical protein [unclassified Pseudomonas]|nr:hypothetical protein [Pseudomonas sp. AL03]MDI3271158.1 hypothetical protein [Pseudomonas sp. AL03]
MPLPLSGYPSGVIPRPLACCAYWRTDTDRAIFLPGIKNKEYP